MKIIELAHRWMGGFIGLLLALLGLSGAILAHKSSWIMLPHAGDAQVRDVGAISSAVERLMTDPAARSGSILFASEDFGLHRLRLEKGAGAYADQTGVIVTRWASTWDRTELWLFDFHHHLWAGKTGATVAGWLAVIGIGFVVTGVILWWRTRQTFEFRLWPKRMTRSAIVRQHRDLGIILSPLLFLALLTGAMLTLRPVSDLLLSPFSSPQEMKEAIAPPKVEGGPLAARPDWQAMFRTAQQRFPDAEMRMLILPRKPGDLIAMRLKQPAEWTPNGRTMVWFDPADGRLIEARDALSLPKGSWVFTMVFPLHAGEVGGLAYRLVMTATGLGLAMLGSLTVWTFWFRRPGRAEPVPAGAVSAA